MKSDSNQHQQVVADNKNMEQIKESNELYRNIIEHTNDIFFTLAPNGEFIFITPRCENIIGYSVEEVMNTIWNNYLTDNPINKIGAEIIKEIFEKGIRPKQFDLEVIHKNGNKIFLQIDGSPIRDAHGKIIAATGAARDITEQKNAEVKLQESEMMFKSAFLGSKVGRAKSTPEGELLMVNQSFCDLVGYSEEELLNMSVQEITSPESQEIHNKEVDALLKGEKSSFSLDQSVLHKKGNKIPVNLNVVLLRNSDGKPTYLISDIVDLTETKNVQTEIDQFFNITLDLLCIAGTDGFFKRLSPGWTKTFGYTEEEFLKKPFFDFIHPDDIQPTIDAVSQLSTQNPVINFINRYKCKDGSYRWLSWVSTPQGEKLFAAAHDITEMKNAEEKLKEVNSKLNTTLTELERSNTELEQFAYVASHDLQEPLRKIKNFAELLELLYKDQLDEKATKFIDYMVSGALRMQGLISDLLTFSRVSTEGKEKFKISLERVIKNTVDNLELSIEESKANIRYENLPEVYADETQMVQLFQNLLGNAIKFRKEESPEIQIESEKLDGEWHISVKDNGIGIDAEYQDRIFEVFQRLHTREEFPGTGIGLAVCKKIVERHGGRIWLESNNQEGSTFHFTIPLN